MRKGGKNDTADTSALGSKTDVMPFVGAVVCSRGVVPRQSGLGTSCCSRRGDVTICHVPTTLRAERRAERHRTLYAPQLENGPKRGDNHGVGLGSSHLGEACIDNVLIEPCWVSLFLPPPNLRVPDSARACRRACVGSIHILTLQFISQFYSRTLTILN